MVPTPTITRRSFLKAMLAAGAAPAIVSAASLLPIYVPPKRSFVATELTLTSGLFVDRVGYPPDGQLVKLVNTPDLGSGAERFKSSSLLLPTKTNDTKTNSYFDQTGRRACVCT